MPRLENAPPGRAWPHFSCDDFSFIGILVVILNLTQVALSWHVFAQLSSEPIQAGWEPVSRGTEVRVLIPINVLNSLWLLVLCLSLEIVLDARIAALASRGTILDEAERVPAVPRALNFRLVYSVFHLGCLVLLTVVSVNLENCCGFPQRSAKAAESCGKLLAWACDGMSWLGLMWTDLWFWELILLLAVQWTGFVVLVLAVLILSVPMSAPKEHGSSLLRGSGFVLSAFFRMAGIGEELEAILEVVTHTMNFDDLSPTDLLWGFFLVWQRQAEYVMPPGLSQALDLRPALGQRLSAQNSEDARAVRELQQVFPYVVGIYGCPLRTFGQSVSQHTSLLDLRRAFCAMCRALPCAQGTTCGGPSMKGMRRSRCCCQCRRCWCCCQPGPPFVNVEGCEPELASCRSYALLRGLEEAGREVEWIYGSWKVVIGGPPPYAIIRDDTLRAVVFTIRGTFSVEDVLHDVLAVPKQVSRRQSSLLLPLPDPEARYAHKGMDECAQLLIDRHLDTLQDLLRSGGSAEGYELICTGHSLGAGIAALIAYKLRHSSALATTSVRAVCVAPPGGLLSEACAKETEGYIVSCVTADDWITRLSIENILKLREALVAEIVACRKSKVQLLWGVVGRFIRKVCCHRFSAAGSKRYSEREILTSRIPCSREAEAFLSRWNTNRQLERQGASACEMHLLPPGRLVFLRPRDHTYLWWGSYRKDHDYVAEWIPPEDFDEIILSLKAVEYHFPNIIESALEEAILNMGMSVRVPPSGCETSSQSSSDSYDGFCESDSS